MSTEALQHQHAILIGGGHSHVCVIKMWLQKRPASLRLTLISPSRYTPYSGMLPGLVAGHYHFNECHIDVASLCESAGIPFIKANVTGLNADQQIISLDNNTTLRYDMCSIDIGSKPDQQRPGFDAFAIAVKPITDFFSHWQTLQAELLQHKQRNKKMPTKIAMIGGGAGSIELISAMQFWAQEHDCETDFHLICRNATLLDSAPWALQKKIIAALQQRKITVHLNNECLSIDACRIHTSQQTIGYDYAYYCTHAAAASWLKDSALDLNEKGFIEVNSALQSTSHSNVFAVGDIAHMIHSPCPKAGVYAVKMSPTLYQNLTLRGRGLALKNFTPQKHFLSLLSLGDQYAVGYRARITFSGRWAWRWKNRIDKNFMRSFIQ